MPISKRRSLLYAPATDISNVEAAVSTDADAVIMDLESTVEEGEKTDARENIATIMDTIDFDEKESVVRINSMQSDRWFSDIEVALESNVDTIRLPKIEQANEIAQAVSVAEQVSGSDPEFLLQLETPQAFLNGRIIAEECKNQPSVTGIGIGMGDYTKSLGLSSYTPELRPYLLNQTAAIASVGEMDSLGFVYKELDGFRDVATLAASLGHVGQPVSSTVPPEKFIEILHDIY